MVLLSDAAHGYSVPPGRRDDFASALSFLGINEARVNRVANWLFRNGPADLALGNSHADIK